MKDNKLIKALILNAQVGNNSAFQQLYQMTIEFIYALLLRLSGDSNTAEKLSIKTYLNAWQQISEKDENLTLINWFKRIAVETYLANSSEDSRDNKETKAFFNKDSERLKNYYNEHPLEKYLQELDYKSKIIFILHDIENLTYDEISEFLQIPVEEIKSMIVNSREKLISLLES